MEKYRAINSLPVLPSEDNNAPGRNRTKTIHLKKIAKCEQEIRQNLFSNHDNSQNKTTKIHSGKNFEDIVKYHKLLQENVTNEMVHLAQSLKHNIETSGEIVKKDTEVY